MNQSRTNTWRRLDNAAKIFPPTSTKKDPKVFRFSCLLTEAVDPLLLQNALDQTVRQFPFFCSVLRKGLFWYYLEETQLLPRVSPEHKPPCAPIYRGDHKDLLFEITYFGRRINLELFHALADGTGALLFLRTLTLYYLREKYPRFLAGVPLSLGYNASQGAKGDDSFQKYYSGNGSTRLSREPRAYSLRGYRQPDHRIRVISGRLSTGQLLAKAHEKEATLTEYLTAQLLLAIFEGMPVRERRHPVVINVPVDLRQFFPSQSARNFFAIINIKYDFSCCPAEFASVLQSVRASFKKKLTQKRLSQKLDNFLALERNLFMRAVPLILKIPLLKAANRISESRCTATFSNLGRISMPEAAAPYIETFEVFNSTKGLQACSCSFGDRFLISFTSPFESTELQCRFFRRLSAAGLAVEISSNLDQTKKEAETDALL